jgi:hypothetical protein
MVTIVGPDEPGNLGLEGIPSKARWIISPIASGYSPPGTPS